MVWTGPDMFDAEVVQKNLHYFGHEVSSLIRENLLRKPEATKNCTKSLCDIESCVLLQRNRLWIIDTQVY